MGAIAAHLHRYSGRYELLAVFCGGVAPRRYIKLLSIPLSFLALSTVAVVIHYADTPSQLLSLKFGGGYLAVDDASLLYGVNLFFTALSAVSCLYFLSLTTPMVDIMGALRRMRCPAILIELMFLMYRFTFVLLDTAHAISTSQKCRLGNRDFRTSLRAAGSLLAVLLQRAMFQSSMLYSAMESRCYDGHIRVLQGRPVLPRRKKRRFTHFGRCCSRWRSYIKSTEAFDERVYSDGGGRPLSI